MDMEQTQGQRFRFGLVCVHGIGMQAKGSTASDLLRAIKLGVTQLDGDVNDWGEVENDDVLVHRVSVVIPEFEPFDLYIYEAWWDKLVDPPPVSTVMRWLFIVAPHISTAIVGALMMDLELLREQSGKNPRSSHPPIEAGLPMLFSTLFTPLFYILSPLIMISCIFPKVGRRVRTLFTSILGDAWLYKSGICEKTVIPHIDAVLSRSNGETDATVLLGHSQGAELSRRTVIHSNAEVAGCVWVGSGRMPLTFLRVVDWRPWYILLFVLYSAIFPALFTWFLQKMLAMMVVMLASLLSTMIDVLSLSQGDRPASMDWSTVMELLRFLAGCLPSFVAMMVMPLIFLVIGWRNSNIPADIDTEPDCEVVAIKSPLDPVSFGTEEGALLRYVPPDSKPTRWLSEHTSYFDKKYTGMVLLEALLGSELVPYEKYFPKPPRWFKAMSIMAMIAIVVIYAVVGSYEIQLFHRFF